MFWRRKKYKFNHSEDMISDALGISVERDAEIRVFISRYWSEFLKGDGFVISQVLESCLNYAKNDNEAVYIAYLVGMLSGMHLVSEQLLGMLSQQVKNIDNQDDRSII